MAKEEDKEDDFVEKTSKTHQGDNSDEVMDKIEIYSSDDEKLKFLGQMLNSDTSRTILQLLIQNEMTANEISDSVGLSLSLVIHHVNKMLQSGIVRVSKTILNNRRQPMKYYTAKSGIVILPQKASKKAKESKSFLKSLTHVMKFTSIGIASLVSWILSNYLIEDTTSSIKVPLIDGFVTEKLFLAAVIPLSVIIIGLIVERILSSRKK